MEPATEADPDDPESGKFKRREFTGRQYPEARDDDDNPKIVSARFSLQPDDLKALDGIKGVEPDMYLEVTKRADSMIRSKLSLDLPRDPRPRERVRKQLSRTVDSGWLPRDALPDENDEVTEASRSLHQLAETLLEQLNEAPEDLSSIQIGEIRDLAERLENSVGESKRKTVQALPEQLHAFADVEAKPNPTDRARNILLRRLPVFLLFDDPQRTLASSYSWEEDSNQHPALGNLLALADTTFERLRDVALDPERKEELQTAEFLANETLEREFRAWHQAKLAVSIRADQNGLELHIRDLETKQHTRLDERSSGLRSFVALIAFCATQAQGRKPLLLVDEAENHLHYEAQANLLKVFERQSVAQNVIYTTHSIGCLPEDLGSTIRVVAPKTSIESEIRNSFWSGDPVGLTPLMLAMGANALAFSPARFAVIGEGPTEAILLPTVLREARGGDPYETLGFQVVPGVAEVHPDDVFDLEREVGEVVFLIDSDPGGKGHVKSKFSERAEKEGRVIELGDGEIPGLCTEDLIRAELLLSAFNQVLSETRPKRIAPLQLADLPTSARSRFFENWCIERSIKPLSKPLIAQRVLDLGAQRQGGILDPTHKAIVKSLQQRLKRIFARKRKTTKSR